MATLDSRQPALDIHLTYPNVFPTESKQWTKHRNALYARLNRRWLSDGSKGKGPSYSAVWRLAFQVRKSGSNKGEIAPHYHILFYPNRPQEPFPGDNPGWLQEFRSWLVQAWYEIVGSEDARHLKAGTRVAILSSAHRRRRYMFYIANYDRYQVGHDGEKPIYKNVNVAGAYPGGTGAIWNCWHKENLPISPVVEIPLISHEQFKVTDHMLKSRIWPEVREDITFGSLKCIVDTDTLSHLAAMPEFLDNPFLQNYVKQNSPVP